jgi:hypothetical protein
MAATAVKQKILSTSQNVTVQALRDFIHFANIQPTPPFLP